METANRLPIRVLHVLGSLSLGGAESRIIDLYRAIDRTKVQFDFLVHTDAAGKDAASVSLEELSARCTPEYFDGEVLSLGGRIFAVPRFTGTNLRAYRASLNRFFTAHAGTWTVIQGHMTSTASVYLPIAKTCGQIPVTIAHARSAGVDPGIKGLATRLLRRPLQKDTACDLRFAVSKEAAESVFGRSAVAQGKVRILPNAIDVTTYAYDEASRGTVRAELDLPASACVIGHVGRFHHAKNHEHLLHTFAAMCAAWQDASAPLYLLCVGDGERLSEMKKLALQLRIADRVRFAGRRSDVAACYQAFDLMLFPSRYEGLPGTVLEAQAAGLTCLISDVITTAVHVTPLVHRMSLSYSAEIWADAALKLYAQAKNKSRADMSAQAVSTLTNTGFDVHTQAAEMERFYLSPSPSDPA